MYKDPPKIKQTHSSTKTLMVQPILTPDKEKKRQQGRRMKQDGEPSFTLTGQDKHGVALRWTRSEKGKQSRKKSKDEKGKDYTPFSDGNRELQLSDDNISGCITGAYNKDSLLIDRLSDYQGDLVTQYDSIQPTLPAQGGNKLRGIGIQNEDMSIRKLTEIECERLQGFNDDDTRWGINEKGEKIEISSSQRYKQTGNSVTIDIVKIIAQRIKQDGILDY